MHSQDQHLQGIEWQGVVSCDKSLPFGLRSAPKLFTAVVNGLTWSMVSSGIPILLHYLDNFFFCSYPNSAATAEALRIVVPFCSEGNLSTVPSKVEGQRTSITILGIEIDSVIQELRLPEPKLTQLVRTLCLWANQQSATQRDFPSLIGLLNHATTVVRPGHIFMHHLIDTMAIPRRQHHKVCLNVQCKGHCLLAGFCAGMKRCGLPPQPSG